MYFWIKRYKLYKILIILFVIFVLSSCNSSDKNISYVQIHWNSMLPALKNWKLYQIEKITDFNTLVKDDIVVFNINWSNIEYIKRLKILPWDKYVISYKNEWKTLVLTINNKFNLEFNNYRNTKFYKTLLLWSNNTNKWWVKAPQCSVFGDNVKVSVDSLEFWFIWCNKITHRIIK